MWSPNRPLDKERILSQLNKTGDSIYEFKNIDIELDENVFLPKISALNELRRNALEQVYNFAIDNIKRKGSLCFDDKSYKKDIDHKIIKNREISVLLNILHLDFDYSKLENIDNIYIPLKYFSTAKYSEILNILQQKFQYLYLYAYNYKVKL